MNQQDRYNQNIQFQKNKENGNIDLAPIYDFSDSNWGESIVYFNDLHNFCIERDYYELFREYPTSLEIFQKIQNTDMNHILTVIEENKEIIIPTSSKDIYLKREEIAQKKLEKIIN